MSPKKCHQNAQNIDKLDLSRKILTQWFFCKKQWKLKKNKIFVLLICFFIWSRDFVEKPLLLSFFDHFWLFLAVSGDIFGHLLAIFPIVAKLPRAVEIQKIMEKKKNHLKPVKKGLNYHITIGKPMGGGFGKFWGCSIPWYF